MLSSEICTALSQTHMFNVCAMCTMKERVGLGVGGRKGWGGMFDRKSQATEYQFENAPSIPLVDCRPCPSKTTLHPIQTSSGGSTPYSVCMSHKPQKSANTIFSPAEQGYMPESWHWCWYQMDESFAPSVA